MRRRTQEGGWCNSTELPRGPSGRALCRRCSVEVPKGRRTFCSEQCIHEWKLRTNSGYLRDQVFRRDRGVCANCGIDTEATKKALQAIRWSDQATFNVRCRELGWSGFGTLWHADHIRAVVAGGGCCGLENLQTLCLRCHKQKTADLAAERAAARKAGQPLPLFDREDAR